MTCVTTSYYRMHPDDGIFSASWTVHTELLTYHPMTRRHGNLASIIYGWEREYRQAGACVPYGGVLGDHLPRTKRVVSSTSVHGPPTPN